LSDALARLQDLLRQLFQFESRELDFGIYRIMNHKRGEIERFIDEGLPGAVEEALKGGAVAQQAAFAEDLRQKTNRVKETFGEYAIDARGELNESFRETPLGKEYLEARSRAGSGVDPEELKAAIFNHVYTFFSRYYDNGDFLSTRRYSRRHKYAIPYNGEEVYLHWANADQYYVKTGEHFTDYRYKHAGVTVRFEISAADTEKNNVKGEKRFFVPRAKEASYDKDARSLTVPFEYRPLTAKEEKAYGARNQQDRILAEAAERLPARFGKQPDAMAALVSEKRRNAKGEPVSLLEHHLRRYTRRNTSDFFIHKDLKGFLEGELDFYLKNEVLDVDDLESWGPDRSEGWFEVMRAVKGVGRSIIAFLAQIEDFQKKLFEKKKFVVSVGYCLTLDHVPEELYGEVAASDAQREEWVRLFAIDGIEDNLTSPGYTEPLTVDFLKDNPHLVLDTKFFDEDFKDRLLASIEDLDEQLDGLLIESENFQALNLLQERYREQVKCIYIDPPYNTGNDDGFVYKDSYQHSSWLSMVNDRLLKARSFNNEDGTIAVSIDDVENGRLVEILDRTYGPSNQLATLVWDRNRKNDAKFFSVGHEYMLVYARNRELLEDKGIKFREPKEGLEDAKAEFERLRKQHGDDWEKVKEGWIAFFDHIPVSDPRRRLMRYAKVGPRGPYRDDGNINWPGSGGPRYEILHPETGKPVKIPTSGWRYRNPARFWEVYKEGKIVFGPNENTVPSTVSYLFENIDQVMPSVFYSYAQTAAQEFNHLFREGRMFDNPKNWRDILRLVTYLANDRDIILDFFAGSGTTAHSVINANRKDGGSRKYILVEMGEYFETVLKPRILKVIYSKDWKDGKPVSREGTSHALKYVKLESYEDTLDNIAFTHEGEGGEALDLFGEDYLLRYMLDFETRGSETLLNVEKLVAPFRYTLRLRDGREMRTLPVDLPETFAYLLGMRVRTRKAHHDGDRRYLVYRGATPERGEVAVVWRDTEGWTEEDYERDERFVREEGLVEGADEVFVNGDSFIPEARPLEAVFKQRMLAEPVHG
jgi:adenine-specific DNA-methyltransferase